MGLSPFFLEGNVSPAVFEELVVGALPDAGGLDDAFASEYIVDATVPCDRRDGGAPQQAVFHEVSNVLPAGVGLQADIDAFAICWLHTKGLRADR